jgi:hypothetical protein
VRAALCFVVAGLLGAAWGGELSACVVSGDCNCPPTPERPERQVELLIDEASAYSAVGNEDVLPTDPRGGSVEVTGDQVVIRYQHDGTARVVVYDVSPLE